MLGAGHSDTPGAIGAEQPPLMIVPTNPNDNPFRKTERNLLNAGMIFISRVYCFKGKESPTCEYRHSSYNAFANNAHLIAGTPRPFARLRTPWVPSFWCYCTVMTLFVQNNLQVRMTFY